MNDIGFLGLGKMGSSILGGILSHHLYKNECIGFYTPSEKTQQKGLNFQINLAINECDLMINSKIIILAIEPQKYDEVLDKVKDVDFSNKVIISLAPGKDIAYLKSVFKNAHVVRAMPNTPSVIGKGVTTLSFDGEPIDEVTNIFSAIGTYVVVNESEMDKAIPLQGSMPAYIFEFVKAFVDTAREYDIKEEDAKKLALNAIIGSCELALQSDKELDSLIDSVCSRGGSTIAGLEAMRKEGFDEAVKACYKACVKRSYELKNSK